MREAEHTFFPPSEILSSDKAVEWHATALHTPKPGDGSREALSLFPASGVRTRGDGIREATA